MTRLLHLRSIRAAIARGERRLADLDAKRTELVRSIAELRDMLPEVRFPLMSQETFRQKVLGDAQDHHEQPEVEYVERPAIIMPKPVFTPTTTVAHTGDDLNAPQNTNAEQASGTARPLEPEVDAVSLIDAAAQAGDVQDGPLTYEEIKKVAERLYPRRGWPKGLSRAKTPCPQSPIPHRHRVADPSKPTEMTCVDIQYPEKAAE